MDKLKYIIFFAIIAFNVFPSIIKLFRKRETNTSQDTVDESNKSTKQTGNTHSIKSSKKTNKTQKKVNKSHQNDVIDYETNPYASQDLSISKFKIFEEETKTENEYLTKIKNPQTVKDAIIISEILNRKYAD